FNQASITSSMYRSFESNRRSMASNRVFISARSFVDPHVHIEITPTRIVNEGIRVGSAIARISLTSLVMQCRYAHSTLAQIRESSFLRFLTYWNVNFSPGKSLEGP